MILVAGATGTLGGAITRQLCARGEAVRVLVRHAADADALVQAGAKPVLGDLKDAASLARACAGVSTVITTANSAARGGADTADSVDRRGNIALIDAARAAGVEHFILTSALGASADSPVEFFQAKAAAEQHLQDSGMHWTITQPNVFMEVWIGMIIGMPLQNGLPVRLVQPGTHRHAFVSLQDVAAFTIAAASNGAARNRTLVIGGPEAHSWVDVVGHAEDIIGDAIPIEFVAPGTALPGLPAVVSQLAAALESYETVFETAPLANEFGVELTSVQQFLRHMLQPAMRQP